MSNYLDVDAHRIARWIAVAKTGSTPEHGLITQCCQDSPFFRHASIRQDGDGRTVISFRPTVPRGRKDLKDDRTMLPVHAAIGRMLEVGGAAIDLHRPSRARNGDGIYQIRLRIGRATTQLPRILFGTQQSHSLREITGTNFRDLVPANYRLTIGPDRDDVLRLIGGNRPELVPILKDLFGLATDWHAVELVTRQVA